MALKKQVVRYYYWLVLEFFKKNGRSVIISFFVSFFGIIGLLSVSPYIKIATTKVEIVGLIGNYDLNNPPEEVINKISNGLVTVTEKGEIIPVIANSWEMLSDGKEYRFHLKENLLWGNGKKFVASDIQYQFKDVEVKIVDDKTVTFFLKKPLAIFPTYLNKPLIKFPLLGVAGYYKVGKSKMEYGYIKELDLVPNTKNLNPLKYKFYNNELQLINAYKKGEVNKITLTKKFIAGTFSTWRNTKVEKKVDYSRLLTIFINGKDKILAEKDMKEALAMSINYEKLSEFGEKANGPIPPNSWAYNPDLKEYSYDPENSSKIVKKLITASESAKLNFVTSYDYYDVADEIATGLDAIGLKNELNVVSFDSPNTFDLFLAFWKVPIDPDQYYFWHSTQSEGNIGNYKNVKIDKLLEDGRNTINIEERGKTYADFQKVIQDDPPAIFLYYPYIYTIKRK